MVDRSWRGRCSLAHPQLVHQAPARPKALHAAPRYQYYLSLGQSQPKAEGKDSRSEWEVLVYDLRGCMWNPELYV